MQFLKVAEHEDKCDQLDKNAKTPYFFYSNSKHVYGSKLQLSAEENKIFPFRLVNEEGNL